jgi:hypothetical protein
MASFKVGARGLCVGELQELLHIKVDRVFGRDETAPAVMKVQQGHGLPPNGAADEQFYAVFGWPFPDLFRRCLGLTNAFENTYYGDCNPTDIDNAGLTMGIIGFTSSNGEAQRLIRAYCERSSSVSQAFSGERRSLFESLATKTDDAQEWGRFFYGPSYERGKSKGMRVLPDVVAAVKVWGADPEMRKIQLDRASQYWETVPQEVVELGLDKGSEAETNAAHALIFDTHVQNGSLRAKHRQELEKKCNTSPAATIREKLKFLAEAVAECAKPEWKTDVLRRKSLFAQGAGVVHGAHYTLDAQALT